MAEFDILWAPLSRKWQIWQKLSDPAGCTIETLIGEYGSEGRANHEAAVLRGELPAGASYEAPRRRRWFLIGGRTRTDRSGAAVEQAPGGDGGIPEQPATPLVAKTAKEKQSEPRKTVADWRKGLVVQLETARRHAEQDEAESVRRILENALLAIPQTDQAA